ncbi:MAG: pitrilysin family protein [Sulfuricellaceae bacterium]|nr:pitrilysin family protein [Sulfuricellaceae bacterium]
MLTKSIVSASLLGLAASFISAMTFAGLPIQHWQTDRGTRVLFVENHDLPLLDVSVSFDAGSRRDVADKAGLAGLTAHLLPLGAGGRKEDEIARRLADVGALLEPTSDQDQSGLVLRTLSSAREREQALELMSSALQQPDFSAEVLAREKARIIAGLKEEATQPGAIAAKAFQASLYGSHPYGQPGTGKIETVDALQRQDLVNFYQRHYHANLAVIALVGDVSRAEAAAIADRLSAQLPAGDGALPALPEVSPLAKPESQTLPHPATQSHILMGAPGMSRKDADYFSLMVGNYILGGGGFASRLTEEVREKRGLAYSVYSYFIPLAQPGAFQIGLQTRRDQANEALNVTRTTLRGFVTEGPTQEELRRAKQNLIGSFPLRLDSNKKILGYLSMIAFYQLPLDYLDRFIENIDRVTLTDVKSAFRRRVDPDNMVTVVVGGEAKK